MVSSILAYPLQWATMVIAVIVFPSAVYEAMR